MRWDYLDAARDDNRIKREKIAKLELLRKKAATPRTRRHRRKIERLNNQIQTWNTGANELRDKYPPPSRKSVPHRQAGKLPPATPNAMADEAANLETLRGSERGPQHGPGQAGRGGEVNEATAIWSKST